MEQGISYFYDSAGLSFHPHIAVMQTILFIRCCNYVTWESCPCVCCAGMCGELLIHCYSRDCRNSWFGDAGHGLAPHGLVQSDLVCCGAVQRFMCKIRWPYILEHQV